jgi:hypothetical protein
MIAICLCASVCVFYYHLSYDLVWSILMGRHEPKKIFCLTLGTSFRVAVRSAGRRCGLVGGFVLDRAPEVLLNY